MRDYQVNSFKQNMNLDISDLDINNSIYRLMVNGEIYSADDNEFSAKTIKGNTKVAQLTPGFAPLGSVTFNNIAFIISHNETSGYSEIGTFPLYDWAISQR